MAETDKIKLTSERIEKMVSEIFNKKAMYLGVYVDFYHNIIKPVSMVFLNTENDNLLIIDERHFVDKLKTIQTKLI